MTRPAAPHGPAQAGGGAESGPAADPATLDALLRGAFATALACAPGGLEFTDPRRDLDQRPWAGRFTTAAALRAPGDPAALAGRAAAALRSVPGIRSAEAVGPGFIAFTPEPRLLAALADRAGEGAAFLTAGAWHALPEPDGSRGPAGAAVAAEPVAGWPLTSLAGFGPVAEARAAARDDARRRIAAAYTAQDRAVGGPAGDAPEEAGAAAAHPAQPAGEDSPAAVPAPEARDDWREPAADALARVIAEPGADAAEIRPREGARGESLGDSAQLLAAIGENAARYAFCRAADDQPKPGELTGPDLPAEPTADRPGAWARATAANPAFAVRLAHARAAASRDGLFSSGMPPFAADSASGEGLAGEQGPGLLAGRPPEDASVPEPHRGAVPPLPANEAGRGAESGGDPLLDPAAWEREPELAAFLGALYDGPGALRAAGRRGRPHMLVRYVEGLAAAYTAVGPSRSAAADAAAAGVLGAALRLLGVSAPTRP